MKLFYAAGSPYARIIRVALRETGLDRRVPEEEVALRDPNFGPAAVQSRRQGADPAAR